MVGVILNLALFFGYHVLWPEGFESDIDLWSLAIAVAAAVALFRFKRSVIQVIAGAGVAGLMIQALTA